MNIEDMVKNMNPHALSRAMAQMSNMLSPEQMKQVQQVFNTSNKNELNQKLKSLSAADLQRELSQNPALAKQLANNPQVMQQINQIFNKK